ncbi:MAG: DUF192 domain-containing protein [Burkholderiales bacterium]
MHNLSRALWLTVLLGLAWIAEADEVVLRIGDYAIEAELADTPKKRERGLMHRDSLADGKGMLFVFSEPGRYSLWMANTKIPLDAAFIDRDGVIVQIVTMSPEETTIYPSPENTAFALEANTGWFARRNIESGARVRGLETVEFESKTGRE